MTDRDLPDDELTSPDASSAADLAPDLDEPETGSGSFGDRTFESSDTTELEPSRELEGFAGLDDEVGMDDDHMDDDPDAAAAAPETRTVYKGSGIRWGFVAGLVLAVLLVILVFQNTDPVQFRFLIWDIETPLAALLIATAVLAAVADELVGLVVRARRRRRLEEKEELKRLRERSEA